MMLNLHDSYHKELVLIGDPHLGKKFTDGVPLERRGQREAEVMQYFTSQLNQDCDLNIMVGDIFDSFVVPISVVIDTAEAYRKAAAERTKTTFILIRGNHDAAKDITLRSSFDLLKLLLADVPNIWVVCDQVLDLGDFAFVPFHATKPQRQFVEEWLATLPEGRKFAAIFGHWEIKSFGGVDFQLLPFDLLRHRTKLIVTGHVHEASDEMYEDGVRIVGTGSMQPYSFGEDSTGEFYVTEPIETVLQNLASDHNYYESKCLRVIMSPTDQLPEINCRQLKVAYSKDVSEETEPMEVEMEQFDFEYLFRSHLTSVGVDDAMVDTVWADYKDITDAA